jgi:hypothetical protein
VKLYIGAVQDSARLELYLCTEGLYCFVVESTHRMSCKYMLVQPSVVAIASVITLYRDGMLSQSYLVIDVLGVSDCLSEIDISWTHVPLMSSVILLRSEMVTPWAWAYLNKCILSRYYMSCLRK